MKVVNTVVSNSSAKSGEVSISRKGKLVATSSGNALTSQSSSKNVEFFGQKTRGLLSSLDWVMENIVKLQSLIIKSPLGLHFMEINSYMQVLFTCQPLVFKGLKTR